MIVIKNKRFICSENKINLKEIDNMKNVNKDILDLVFGMLIGLAFVSLITLI